MRRNALINIVPRQLMNIPYEVDIYNALETTNKQWTSLLICFELTIDMKYFRVKLEFTKEKFGELDCLQTNSSIARPYFYLFPGFYHLS